MNVLCLHSTCQVLIAAYILCGSPMTGNFNPWIGDESEMYEDHTCGPKQWWCGGSMTFDACKSPTATPTAQPTASICMRCGFERRIDEKKGACLSSAVTRQHEM